MYDKPVFLTREGRQKLEAELSHLKDMRRPEIAERIRLAKAYSDTMDNADFEEAKNELAFLEGRILTLGTVIGRAQIIESEHQPRDAVRLGSKVAVLNDKGEMGHYTIVGSAEASPREGRISNESPVGRSLLGRKIGEQVEVAAPAGLLRITVLAIE